MWRSITPLGLLACLALAAVGCGSGSAGASGPTEPASSGLTEGGASGAAGPGEAGSISATSRRGEGGQGAPLRSKGAGGMRSILEYGSSAGRRETAAASAAARSYFTALADRDYGKICAALSAGNRHQLQAFLKLRKFQGEGCAGVVRNLLVSPQITSAARRAAQGRVSAVRVKGGTAFVLFKPVGGSASFFVLKREGGDWKATSLMPGLPLNPTAP